MPRTGFPKIETVNFRVDRELKTAFAAATTAEDKPAAQVLRDFMRFYVERRRARTIAQKAGHQSRAVIGLATDPSSDENEVLRWIDDVSDIEGWQA